MSDENGKIIYIPQQRFNDQNWRVEESDLLIDVKYLLKEFYVATITENGDSLKIALKNGQTFIITVREDKKYHKE